MTACKNPVATCPVCAGPIYRRKLRTCSNKCAGSLRRKDGPPRYVSVSRNRREHVLIAEAAIGRSLVAGEQVHHVNEVKSDNRPENLVICVTRRLHALLHVVPELISKTVWLGVAGESVRLFRRFEPKGTYYCIKCHRCRPIGRFDRSKKYASGVRGDCVDCRRRIDKENRRIYRATHPLAPRVYVGSPGEKNPAVKLTDDDVITIREEHTRGVKQTHLAAEFSVSQSTISLIVLRKHWRHL